MKAKKRVHVAVLNTGEIVTGLSEMLNLMLLRHRCGHAVSLQYYGGDYWSRPIASSRNRIVRDSPKDADFILMLDADVVPPPDVLMLASYDLDVIASPAPVWRPKDEGGPVITGIVPLEPTTGPIEIGGNGLLECRRVGWGACCIAKRVYKHPQMRGAFADLFDEDGVITTTEDYVYCDRARALGFRCWAALAYPVLAHVKPVNLVDIHDVINEARP